MAIRPADVCYDKVGNYSVYTDSSYGFDRSPTLKSPTALKSFRALGFKPVSIFSDCKYVIDAHVNIRPVGVEPDDNVRETTVVLTQVLGAGFFNALKRQWEVSTRIGKPSLTRISQDAAKDLEVAFAMFFLDWKNAHR